MPLGTIPFYTNARRGMSLGYCITIYYPDWDETTNDSVRNAVEACHGMTTPLSMRGSYVVVSGPSLGRQVDRNDITLTDFRHTLDFFSTYFDNTIYEAPKAHCREALRVSCPLHESIYGWDMFTQVWIARDFASDNTVSTLATALLGYVIRICKLGKTEAEGYVDLHGPDESSQQRNRFLSALNLRMDPSDILWGTSDTWISGGTIIITRDDRQALNHRLAEKACRYCKDILEPLLKDLYVVRFLGLKSFRRLRGKS